MNGYCASALGAASRAVRHRGHRLGGARHGRALALPHLEIEGWRPLRLRRAPLEADIIAALGAGADDFLVKGISIEEMLSRVEVGRRVTRSESADHRS